MTDIVMDSSIWQNNYSFGAVTKKDMSVRTGMVREELFDPTSNITKYVVEVFDKTNQVPVVCVRLDKFGGAYNYEEYTHRINPSDARNLSSGSKYAVRPGDVVLVAYAGGDSREGFILGGVKHPSRPENTNKSTGIAYQSEFNGIQTIINSDGEYKITFRGIPTNIAELDKPSAGNNVPAPTYNTAVGTSYLEFDKTGSWTLNDSAQSKPQNIKIDKPNGKIIVTSGDVVITMDKNAQLISMVTKDMTVNASNSITKTTQQFSLTASTFTKIKSPKVAIGTDAIELLNELVLLIDNLARVVIYAPEGPCAPFGTSEEWPAVEKNKQNINTIRGSL